VLTPATLLDLLLLPSFLLALGAWGGVSLLLLLRGLAGGRRAMALARARQALDGIRRRELEAEAEQSAIVTLVATLPEHVLLPLGAAGPHDTTAARRLAEAIVARLGRAHLELLASTPGHPRHNARRIAAMELLTRAHAPAISPLLARMVDDRDQEIVGASLAMLARIPDAVAATALVDALKQAKYTPSRIATYLDQFGRPVGEALRPLLHHPDPNVRYWGATLLSRHPVAGIELDLAALAGDPAPLVRKAAVASLAELGGARLAEVAMTLLADASWFVRAHAARALASTGNADFAEPIAMLLTDREWWVRLAAKESLQQLGDEVWAVLVPYLDHEDGFARNGAAEVLQNIGVLDSLIVLEAATSRPSAAKLEMLRKIAHAGGTRMTSAMLERVDDRARPRVRALLETLGLEPAGVRS
jgi:HEAT repeat protein